MKTFKNIKKQIVQKENLNVIFLDFRNSTKLYEKFTPEEMFDIYSEFLNNSYDILKSNGYQNMDIQGDGIYGVIEWNKFQAIANCINKLEKLIDHLNKKFKIKITMASFSGEECFQYFGPKNNFKKQIAFFNGLVSMSKKIISYSSNDIKIIINEKLKTDLSQNCNFSFDNHYFNDVIKEREFDGKFWLKKMNEDNKIKENVIIDSASNAYQELEIMLSHYGILLQKVVALITINVLIIGLSLTIANFFSPYFYIISVYYIFCLILDIFILLPNFKHKKNTNFFLDYKDWELNRIQMHINDKENTLNQLQINSNILSNKYKFFLFH